MSFRPYERRHIATDPLHRKDEERYAVVEVATGAEVLTSRWPGDIAARADALCRAAGACAECNGHGSVVEDFVSGPDGETPLAKACPDCDGTGRGPAARKRQTIAHAVADAIDFLARDIALSPDDEASREERERGIAKFRDDWIEVAGELRRLPIEDFDDCCPVCQEVTCDEGCPLAPIRRRSGASVRRLT